MISRRIRNSLAVLATCYSDRVRDRRALPSPPALVGTIVLACSYLPASQAADQMEPTWSPAGCSAFVAWLAMRRAVLAASRSVRVRRTSRPGLARSAMPRNFRADSDGRSATACWSETKRFPRAVGLGSRALDRRRRLPSAPSRPLQALRTTSWLRKTTASTHARRATAPTGSPTCRELIREHVRSGRPGTPAADGRAVSRGPALARASRRRPIGRARLRAVGRSSGNGPLWVRGGIPSNRRTAPRTGAQPR